MANKQRWVCMDKETKKILDRLCADKMDVQEAANALDMSVEEVFELADNYDYIPTSEEVIKACKIEQETINHIKFIALQKVETKVRSKIFEPQLLSTPSIREVPIRTCGEENIGTDFMQHSFMKAMLAKFGEQPKRMEKDATMAEIISKVTKDMFKSPEHDAPSMKILEKFGTDRGDISSPFEVPAHEA